MKFKLLISQVIGYLICMVTDLSNDKAGIEVYGNALGQMPSFLVNKME